MDGLESFYQHPAALEGIIRRIAKTSSNVRFPESGSGKADVSISLVFACLESGTVHSNPEPNEYNHIACKLRHVVAGVELFVDLVVDVVEEEIHILFVEV